MQPNYRAYNYVEHPLLVIQPEKEKYDKYLSDYLDFNFYEEINTKPQKKKKEL